MSSSVSNAQHTCTHPDTAAVPPRLSGLEVFPFFVYTNAHEHSCKAQSSEAVFTSFLIILAVALLFSACGFKKYVWFISLGYGFAVAAIVAALMILFRDTLTAGTIIACVLFLAYGIRLSGYLAHREIKRAAYNAKMKTEIKSGKGMKFGVKCAIWTSAALLYACETAPVLFRLQNGAGTDEEST